MPIRGEAYASPRMPHQPRVQRAGTGSVSAEQYNVLVEALGGSLVSEEFLFTEDPKGGTLKAVCDLPPDAVLVGVTVTTLTPWSKNTDQPWTAGDESNPKLIMDNVLCGSAKSKLTRWGRQEQQAPWSGTSFSGVGQIYPDGQYITVSVTSPGGTGTSVVRVFALAPRSSTPATRS